MAHHQIVIKLWAEDEDNALQEALDLLEQSLDVRNNVCGWDDIDHGDTFVITDVKKVTQGKCTTFKELEKSLKKQTKDTHKELIKELEEKLKPDLAEILLTKREAALCITDKNEDFKEIVSQRLKAKEDLVVPKFPDIVTHVAECLALAMNPWGNNLMYLLKRIDRIQLCNLYPYDTGYTLQSKDNSLAVIPNEDKKSKHCYYVHCSRHY
jgi:hypothetical protein